MGKINHRAGKAIKTDKMFSEIPTPASWEKVQTFIMSPMAKIEAMKQADRERKAQEEAKAAERIAAAKAEEARILSLRPAHYAELGGTEFAFTLKQGNVTHYIAGSFRKDDPILQPDMLPIADFAVSSQADEQNAPFMTGEFKARMHCNYDQKWAWYGSETKPAKDNDESAKMMLTLWGEPMDKNEQLQVTFEGRKSFKTKGSCLGRIMALQIFAPFIKAPKKAEITKTEDAIVASEVSVSKTEEAMA